MSLRPTLHPEPVFQTRAYFLKEEYPELDVDGVAVNKQKGQPFYMAEAHSGAE